MARDWVELFKSWAKPPSDTEETKGSNAARMINDALREHSPLKARNFDVYATGSYRNNTNIRLGSDIDVAIVLADAFFGDYSAGNPTREMLGFIDAAYGLNDFRDDVHRALLAKFGAKGIAPGDKTFNVHENSYRLDADATVFLEHRRYGGSRNPDGTWQFHRGVETRSRSQPDRRIINWHEQHYSEGVARNAATRRRFKRITRILKRLRDDMSASSVASVAAAAKPIPSFLVECLVFNAPDTCFNREDGSYYEDTKAVIGWLWNATKAADACQNMVEVSRFKYLFRPTQPWARESAHEFLLRAWQHVGFKQ